MLGLFLQPNATDLILAAPVDAIVKKHAIEVVEKGYTVVKKAISPTTCDEVISAFRAFERRYETVFAEYRTDLGHYPRIVNLHRMMPQLLPLFTRNSVWLQVQDLLFGAPTTLYTSLFYEVGSQQPLHRDTPVFSTRPEYLYFGTTVYLEAADDENGCLEVMEGGHRLPEPDREQMALKRYGSLSGIPTQDNAMWSEYQNAVLAHGRALGLPCKRVHVEAGDSLIWHPQLPHGGSPIKDPMRTRMSLVMHTTPQGVPVYHQDAFFNPRGSFSERAPWKYVEVDGRMIADLPELISFGHVRNYSLAELAGEQTVLERKLSDLIRGRLAPAKRWLLAQHRRIRGAYRR